MIAITLPEFTDIGREFAICFEACVATLCRYINRHYEMMFLNQLQIYYQEGVTDFNQEMAQCFRSSDHYLEYLEKYHGIQLHYYDQGDYIKIAQEELAKGKPTILHLDVFYCPWDPLFHKIHNCHMGIITGVDEKYIYVCDPYDRVLHEKLLISDVHKHSQFIYTYDLRNVTLTKEQAKKVFQEEICKEYPIAIQALKKSYECIISQLENIMDENEKVFELLFEFTKGRIIQYANFSYLLKYLLNPLCEQYEEVLDKLNENVKELYRIKNLSMKLKIVQSQKIILSIKEYFQTDLVHEEQMYQLLMTV